MNGRNAKTHRWPHTSGWVAEGMSDEDAWAEATGQDVETQRREAAIAQLRGDGYTGRGFDELARAAYRRFVDAHYWQAEADTNGYLLNNAGQAAGINPRELFEGPAARARKWASDELLEWWDNNGRVTFDEFAAQLLGDIRGARESVVSAREGRTGYGDDYRRSSPRRPHGGLRRRTSFATGDAQPLRRRTGVTVADSARSRRTSPACGLPGGIRASTPTPHNAPAIRMTRRVRSRARTSFRLA